MQRKILRLPDNATRSFVSKPTAENLDVMLARVSNGDGREVLALAWFAVKLSLLPSNTVHEGPCDCKNLHFIKLIIWVKRYTYKNDVSDNFEGFIYQWFYITRDTEDSAASARISAQDTTPGHELSTELLMLSTTSYPRTELALGSASFSLCVMLPPTSSKMDPSHP